MARSLLHMLRYMAGTDPAQTQTTESERACIKRYACGRKRCVEIGVFEGVTTGVIASTLDSDAILYAIDPFIAGRAGICWGMPIAKREIAKHRPKCQIKIVRAFSPEANKQVEGDFDFIFIDGDHSLEGIKQDWNDWSVRIQPGGVIGLHDTIVPAHNPKVANLGSHRYFVDHIQYDDRFEILEQIDSLSILRRK